MSSDGHDNVAKTQAYEETTPAGERHINHVPLEDTGKSRWERLWPVIACGAGLFSDGYLNAVRLQTISPASMRTTYLTLIQRSSAP
jgi:hypothetical protein